MSSENINFIPPNNSLATSQETPTYQETSTPSENPSTPQETPSTSQETPTPSENILQPKETQKKPRRNYEEINGKGLSGWTEAFKTAGLIGENGELINRAHAVKIDGPLVSAFYERYLNKLDNEAQKKESRDTLLLPAKNKSKNIQELGKNTPPPEIKLDPTKENGPGAFEESWDKSLKKGKEHREAINKKLSGVTNFLKNGLDHFLGLPEIPKVLVKRGGENLVNIFNTAKEKVHSIEERTKGRIIDARDRFSDRINGIANKEENKALLEVEKLRLLGVTFITQPTLEVIRKLKSVGPNINEQVMRKVGSLKDIMTDKSIDSVVKKGGIEMSTIEEKQAQLIQYEKDLLAQLEHTREQQKVLKGEATKVEENTASKVVELKQEAYDRDYRNYLKRTEKEENEIADFRKADKSGSIKETQDKINQLQESLGEMAYQKYLRQTGHSEAVQTKREEDALAKFHRGEKWKTIRDKISNLMGK